LYVGHVALAMVAKSARPRIPMALLVPVAFAPDWIEWFFDPTGHRNREISHSLVSVGIAATLVALAYFVTTRARADAIAVWLMYALHWPADFITGLKPTWPGGPMVGLYLYKQPDRGHDRRVAHRRWCAGSSIARRFHPRRATEPLGFSFRSASSRCRSPFFATTGAGSS
jgi:hypothetical protein